MRPETLDTVIRHLKGIVAALEKERLPKEMKSDMEWSLTHQQPDFATLCYMGKPLTDCTDEELQQAKECVGSIADPIKRMSSEIGIREEIRIRALPYEQLVLEQARAKNIRTRP